MRSRWAARFLVGALVALAGAVPAGAVNVVGSNGPDSIYGTGRADRIDGRGCCASSGTAANTARQTARLNMLPA